MNQDPLENYFGKQRSRGGRSDNPNVSQYLDSAFSLRVQESIALDPVRGNSSRKRRLNVVESKSIDETPLSKQKVVRRK